MESFTTSQKNIRTARPEDYKIVAPLIIQAMEELVCIFISSSSANQGVPLFEEFFQQPGNQYSFENTLVFEQDGKIVGSLTAYNGAALAKLRKPFLAKLKDEYGLENFNPGDETEAGELYIDTLSVVPEMQGRGIGTQLIRACIEKAKQLKYPRVGLLVDPKKTSARKLYEKLGFQQIKTRNFMGVDYLHMQIKLNN